MSASHTAWTFIVWTPFLSTYASSLADGDFMAICVQSIAPMTFGNPPAAWNANLFASRVCWSVGNVINCEARFTRALVTLLIARLTEDCDNPQLRPTIHWKLPVAKNCKAASSWVSADRAVGCSISPRSISWSCSTAIRGNRVVWKISSSDKSFKCKQSLLIFCWRPIINCVQVRHVCYLFTSRRRLLKSRILRS